MVTNLPASAGDEKDTGLISVSGRSPGGGIGNPHQYSCLENFMDRRAWLAAVQEVAGVRRDRAQPSKHSLGIMCKKDFMLNQCFVDTEIDNRKKSCVLL